MSGVVSASGLVQNPGGRNEFEVTKAGNSRTIGKGFTFSDELKISSNVFKVKFRQYDIRCADPNFQGCTKYAGHCRDSRARQYDYVQVMTGSLEQCFNYCESLDLENQVGLAFLTATYRCECNYDDGELPSDTKGGTDESGNSGYGAVASGSGGDRECYPRKVRSSKSSSSPLQIFCC